MDNDYIESVWWSLRQIWDDDRLYEGHKVVPYCPRCGTALTSHEVAQGYQDVEDPSVYVRLPVTRAAPSDQIPESPLEPGDKLLVWTTTPWTLISQRGGRRRRRHRVRARAPARRRRGRRGRRGRWSRRCSARAPRCWPTSRARRWRAPPTSRRSPTSTDYGPRGHTVLLGDFVTTEDGTGLVHTALAFGEDDFRLGEQYGITLQNPVLPRRHLRRARHRLRGPLRQGGRPRHRRGAASERQAASRRDYEHAYPHCWRCDTPLLYYAKSSWYIAHHRGQGPDARRERARSAGTPSTSSTGASASGWRATSTGRSRASATGARRCRSGSASEEDCEERFCAGSIAGPARARRRGPRRPPPPLHRRGRARPATRRLRRARCAASRR